MKPGRKIITAGLLETAACAALVLFVSWKTQNLHYIAIWSLLGWTQMLRTRRSTVLALRWFCPVFNAIMPQLSMAKEWLESITTFPDTQSQQEVADTTRCPLTPLITPIISTISFIGSSNGMKSCLRLLFPPLWPVYAATAALIGCGAVLALIAVFLAVVVLVVSASIVRTVATLAVATRHPAKAIKAIPSNWRRIGWSMELLSPLEFVPRHALLLRLQAVAKGRSSPIEDLGSFIPRFGARRQPRMLSAFGCLLAMALLTLPVMLLVEPSPPRSTQAQASAWHEPGTARKSADEIHEPVNPATLEALDSIMRDYLEPYDTPKSAKAELDQVAPPIIKNPKLKPPFKEDLSNEAQALLRDAEERWREYARNTKPSEFNVMDLGDWLVWSDWYGRWPVRAFGEGWITEHLAKYLPFAVLAVGFIGVAVYFGLWSSVILIAMITPLRGLLFLPALTYRLSLKASTLTYAPLFFVIEAPFAHDADPKRTFERIQEDAWPAVQRAIAKVLALILLVNVSVAIALPTFKAQLPSQWADFLQGWHFALTPTNIASGIVLLCTFGVWYLTRHALWQLKSGSITTLVPTSKIVRTMDRLRSMLSIYTLSCALYWAATSLFPNLGALVPPEIKWIFLPWNRH